MVARLATYASRLIAPLRTKRNLRSALNEKETATYRLGHCSDDRCNCLIAFHRRVCFHLCQILFPIMWFGMGY